MLGLPRKRNASAPSKKNVSKLYHPAHVLTLLRFTARVAPFGARSSFLGLDSSQDRTCSISDVLDLAHLFPHAGFDRRTLLALFGVLRAFPGD
jgi:hypothetical protein